MKTSFVAVVGATLFLIAVLVGIGGSGSPAAPPIIVTLAQPGAASASALVPATGLPTPTSTAGSVLPPVDAVGRDLQQNSIESLLAAGQPPLSSGSGPAFSAAGQPGTQHPGSTSLNAVGSVVPQPGPPGSSAAPVAASPVGGGGVVASPSPGRPLLGNLLPPPRPRPKPKPPPSPVVSPLPSPTIPVSVTTTATPPVTSTAVP
jgi:hypothetical protein